MLHYLHDNSNLLIVSNIYLININQYSNEFLQGVVFYNIYTPMFERIDDDKQITQQTLHYLLQLNRSAYHTHHHYA